MRSSALYQTPYGSSYSGDSYELLDELEAESVQLVITSPPFALLREKSYGNRSQDEYVDWLMDFGRKVQRVLASDGSFVLDLGGAYQRGVPVRSLYQYKVLIRFCEELGFFLAKEFYWHNPSKLPSPIEWVNKRKIRAKDTVNTLWWFSKTEWPYANVSEVLTEYSPRMKKLLADSASYYRPKERPSGHDISGNFDRDNGGAIPSNLLQIPNTESNSQYLRYCQLVGAEPHPARFPAALPSFFIRFLTQRGDTVLDIFAGSNTTGEAAEKLGASGWPSSNTYRMLQARRFDLPVMSKKQVIFILRLWQESRYSSSKRHSSYPSCSLVFWSAILSASDSSFGFAGYTLVPC